jgi:HAD superfamily hydrolase (TIGR01450 family)
MPGGVTPEIGAVLFDLDGTVYHGGAAIDGAAEFIARLRTAGIGHQFVTNRANRRPAEIADHLTGLGIPCQSDAVLTSAAAAATLVAGRRVAMIGTKALAEALVAAGAIVTEDRPDDVVVGYDPNVCLEDITRVSRLILAGARFVATNPDPWITSEAGVMPENGAVLAAIQAVTGRVPRIAGKPERAIVDLALRRLGVTAGAAILVGDNPMTDIAAARAAGLRSALILTGVSDAEAARAAPFTATWTVRDYAELSAIVFG